MILSAKKILEEINNKNIIIKPFSRKIMDSNSYDVHLSKWLAVNESDIIDAKLYNKIRRFEFLENGFILLPSRLYLGVTLEYTQTRNYFNFVDEKSSAGRLGIGIHSTAGIGDAVFCNT